MHTGCNTNKAALLALAAASLFACAASQQAPASRDAHGESVADGKVLYEQYCSTCHGVKGDGHGPTADLVGKPAPRDFTRGLYEFRTTETTELPLRADVVRTIANGVHDTTMPAFRGLMSDRDLDAVSHYVEGFSGAFAETPEKDRMVVSIPEAPATPTPEQLEEGRMFYFAFSCWNCHGVHGHGDGPGVPGLKDKWNRPIRPANLTRPHAYKGGFTPSDVYRTIATGLDGTPMSSYAKTVVLPPLRGADGQPDLSEQVSVPGGTLEPGLRASVVSFIATLPTRAQLAAMSDTERDRLRERRLWLLVGYVRSLPGQRSALSRLYDWATHDPGLP